jgi:pimeloyl-ACP methyl ester carboxylesterase
VVSIYRSAPELVTHLVLCATNLTHDTPLPPPLNTFVWPLVGSLFARLVLSEPSLRMTLRKAVGEPKVELPLDDYFGDRMQTRAIQRIFEAAIRELEPRYRAVHETLRTIRVPTRVFWGSRDPFFDVAQGRRTADLIPNAVFTVLEGCGHFVPEERPEALTEYLLSL